MDSMIRWYRVFFGVLIGSMFFAILFSLWYWAYVWLPQKESRAMQAHFETVEKQWLLKKTTNNRQPTTNDLQQTTTENQQQTINDLE